MRHLFTSLLASLTALCVNAQSPNDTPVSQMEHLDRGLIAISYATTKCFVGWRLLGTDNQHTTFQLLKNGTLLQDDIYKATSLTVDGTKDDKFQVVTVQDGVPVDTTAEVSPWAQPYLPIKLNRPAAVNNAGYAPNDMSVGDADGDGQYELFVKWDPQNSKDNAQSGVTSPVVIDCYRLDGTQLWRVNLGNNIRAGAHYTQFMVYDFDGDGKAEMICKTAPGSKDGEGQYVSMAATDNNIKNTANNTIYRNGDGRILTGPEFLTVFDGMTGKALHTIWYNPNRAGKFNQIDSHPAKSFWNDDYGNRADRHLACVAFLDGPDKNPSAVMCRGYYTRAYLWAVDFDGKQLHHKWLHASVSNNNVEFYDADWKKTTRSYTTNTGGKGAQHTMFGNGNHNLSVGDVDGDGCDEIIWGSAAVDNDGSLLYSVGFGHGDAIHMADLNPDRPGYEVMDVHESDIAPYGADVHDARTGEVLVLKTSSRDTGRGLAADYDSRYRGCEFTYATQTMSYTIDGKAIVNANPGMNFRIYWDGDPYEELLDNVTISKWNNGKASALGMGFNRNMIATYGKPASCNSTKATPCLTADLFGDWREEVILWSTTDSCTINIYSSGYTTDYRVPTLMHDHLYRMGVAWQNVAYNQPPHLGYYLEDYIDSFQGISVTGIHQHVGNTAPVDNAWYTLQGIRIGDKPTQPGIYINKNRKIRVE